MNEIDFERAALLMDIQQKVANISPQNSFILGEANLELQEINKLAHENAQERAEERRLEETNREAETQAKLREDNPLEEVVKDDLVENDPSVIRRPAPAPALRRPV